MHARALVAEFLGTAFLLMAIIGSGLAVSADAPASTQLFQHALVIGAALTALILVFGPVSGAHFNPVVTLADAALGGIAHAVAALYVGAQLAGAFLGVVVSHAMFGEPLLTIATKPRVGAGLFMGEIVATIGLLVVIFGTSRASNARAVPAAVGTYLTAAIFFTSSDAFANPAVTLVRTLTDSYTGMAAGGVPAFLLAQLLGAAVSVGLVRWLFAPQSGVLVT